jgi:aminopeptidase N
MRRLATALLLILLSATSLFAATRLPVNVIPGHYRIAVTPDLSGETFSGTVTIDVDVREPSDSVTLHSVGLTLHDISIDSGGKRLTATDTADTANEMVTLKTAETLEPGPAAIHIAFEGKLGQQLRGLYLSTTAKRKYAVTQFEAMSARLAFPCFDEPAMKATFDITLVVDEGDTAISNGVIVSDQPDGHGKHVIRFATTTRLPTYLVAMLIGDFQCISGSADGIPIRVCSTPGLQDLGHYSLSAAEASIKFFDEYYGIKYPFKKLDLIGIPDFAAGAMENAGAITFRETDLLVDEKTASVVVEKRVAEVVAHEIAHQWFGDLVTMQWWNDIWLNEGFATFMSEKPLEAWKPEWRTSLDKPARTDDALTVDSQLSTRPIRVPVTAAGEGGALFDAGITYGKTAAVLRMVEEWIGRDAFRDAIRTYLKKYSFGNAAAEDFWATMKASSQRPIDTVLESFIDRTGVPLLHVEESCANGQRQVTLSQERLLPKGQTAPPEVWTIPVCSHVIGSAASEPCRVMTKSTETLTLTSCNSPLSLARGGAAYFAADYSPAERTSLREHIAELPSQERIWFHGNEWLLVRNDHRDVGEYLGLLRAIPRPAERPLVAAIADSLIFLNDRLVSDVNRTAWQAFVHDALRGDAQVTWTMPPGETGEQRIARATVLWALGYAARDKDVIDGARHVADQYMKDPASVDAVIADRALRLSAVYGDEAFFDRVVQQLGSAPTPELASRYRGLLPLFRDPKLTARAIEYIYSDRVRLQDLSATAAAMFADPVTRPAAWTAAKSHWSELEKRAPMVLSRISGATSSFCNPESKKEIEAFLTEHPPRGGSRAVSRAMESIDTCIAFRAAQQEGFDRVMKGSDR